MVELPSAVLETYAAHLVEPDDGRVHLICIRPTGPYKAFDERLTSLAIRLVRMLRVTILRPWECADHHDWMGFVSGTVPTVLVVRGGEIVAKSVGDLPVLDLERLTFGGR